MQDEHQKILNPAVVWVVCTQRQSGSLTFGSLHADLQRGHPSLGGVHCEGLRDVCSDVVAQTWTLTLHLGAVHGVTDGNREWASCRDRETEREERNKVNPLQPVCKRLRT